MVVQSNSLTQSNWMVIANNVGGLRYSYETHSGDYSPPSYSLDEELIHRRQHTWGSRIRAEQIIDIIGAAAFKRLVEATWDPNYHREQISGSNFTVERWIASLDVTTAHSEYTFWKSIWRLCRDAHI